MVLVQAVPATYSFGAKAFAVVASPARFGKVRLLQFLPDTENVWVSV